MRGVFTIASGPADFDGSGRRYVVGRNYCFWQDGRRADGTVLWGRPLEQDIAELEPYWDLGTGDPAWDGRVGFVDARAVESVDAFAFRRLLSYLVHTQQTIQGVSAVTMVHGGGLVGVVAAGLLSVVRPSYPFRVVGAEQLRDAFVAAGVDDLYDAVDALREQVGAVPDIVRQVRAIFSRQPGADREVVAERLGLSARTLQRRLDAAGTSLRREKQAHILNQAEELLAFTDLDLDAIAAQLALASASHLVTIFHRQHGVTPGEWRRRRQR